MRREIIDNYVATATYFSGKRPLLYGGPHFFFLPDTDWFPCNNHTRMNIVQMNRSLISFKEI